MRSGTRQGLAVVCLAASIMNIGCGTLFDVTYLIGSKRYNESKEERKPTGQVVTSVEYDSALNPDGSIRIACEERDRSIQRTFSVSKTYEYRGGFTRTSYISAAILSAVVGGAVAGIVAIGCNLPPQPGEKDPKRWSCINALWATPFAVDFGYSLVRIGMAKKPKLVDKQKNEGLAKFADVPSRANAVSCDSIDRVVLGSVTGPSDAEMLNFDSGQNQQLMGGALPVARAEDGSIKLSTQPEIVQAWVRNPSLNLLVVNREGKPRPITVLNRCDALRPSIPTLQGPDLSMFVQQCPVQTVPGAR